MRRRRKSGEVRGMVEKSMPTASGISIAHRVYRGMMDISSLVTVFRNSSQGIVDEHTGMCPSVGMSVTWCSVCASLFGASGAPRTALRRVLLPFAPRVLCEREEGGALGRDLVRTAMTCSSSTKSASGARSSSSELMSLYETLRLPRLRGCREDGWRWAEAAGSGAACSLPLETWSTAWACRVDRRVGTVRFRGTRSWPELSERPSSLLGSL